MAKQKVKDIKKELDEQEDEVYGEGTISGSSPDPDSDDDVVEAVGDAFGADAVEEAEDREPMNIAKEIREDEESRRTKPELHVEDED